MTDAELLDAEMPRALHADYCEAEPDHPGGCATMTEMARLRAFAEAVREEWECTMPEGNMVEGEERPDDHVDDCWHCYAEQVLERVK